jgi:hypothetical protein
MIVEKNIICEKQMAQYLNFYKSFTTYKIKKSTIIFAMPPGQT